MLKFKKNKTNKLYYKSYPYKISTEVPGGIWIKHYGIKNVLNENFRLPKSFINDRNYTNAENNLVKEYASKLELILQHQCITRVESSTTNLFLKDKNAFDFAVKELQKFITATWEPNSEHERDLLLDNKKIIIVNQYPHKIYSHKVIFKNMPEEKRRELYVWFNKYSETIFKLSKSTKAYLSDKRKWMQNPFVLVSDVKMLTMLSLMNNEYIKNIEQYVLRSHINTEI